MLLQVHVMTFKAIVFIIYIQRNLFYFKNKYINLLKNMIYN